MYFAVSSKSSKDKIDMLRSMGAKVYVCQLTFLLMMMRSYYNVAKRLHEETKGSVYINQYFNDLNVDETLQIYSIPEIWEQTLVKLLHLVACRWNWRNYFWNSTFLKEKSNIKVLGVDALVRF